MVIWIKGIGITKDPTKRQELFKLLLASPYLTEKEKDDFRQIMKENPIINRNLTKEKESETTARLETFYMKYEPRGFENDGYPEVVLGEIRKGKYSHIKFIASTLLHDEFIKKGAFRDKYFECAPLLYSIPAVIRSAEQEGIIIPESRRIMENVEKLYSLITSPKTDFSTEHDPYIDELSNELAEIGRKLLYRSHTKKQ